MGSKIPNLKEGLYVNYCAIFNVTCNYRSAYRALREAFPNGCTVYKDTP